MPGKPRDRRVQAAPMDAAPELFGADESEPAPGGSGCDGPTSRL